MKLYHDDQNREEFPQWHPFSEQFTYINGLGVLPETPRQKERKQLVLQYNVLFFAILLFYFLRVAVTLPVLRFLLFLGFDVQINPNTGIITLSEQATQWGNILCCLLTYGLPVLFIWGILKRFFSAKRMFSLPYSGISFYGICIILGTSVVASLSSFLFTELLQVSGLSFAEQRFEIPTEPGSFILLLLTGTLLEAFVEEFLFRGVILNSMRRFGDVVALLVSTILYALVQTRVDTMIYSFVMGLVLSYFALRSGSFLLPFLGSFFAKGVGMFFWMLHSGTMTLGRQLLAGGVLLAIGILTIFSFIRFVTKDKNAFRIYDRETYLTNRSKMKYFLTNVGFWMVAVLFFFQAIKNIEIIN